MLIIHKNYIINFFPAMSLTIFWDQMTESNLYL